jgi:ligand-binding sensor domain-containing protein
MSTNRRLHLLCHSIALKRFMASFFLFLGFLVSNSQTFAQNPQWMVFDTLNSPLPGNEVSVVILDDSGNKWMVSRIFNNLYTLTKFDDFNWTIYDASNSALPATSFSNIAAENQNTIWLATAGAGIIRLKDGLFTVFDYTNICLPQGSWVFSIAIDANGIKWFATEHGLLSYNDTTWMLYDQSNSGLPADWIYNVSIDTQGNKWIGTRPTGGIVKYNDSVWVVYDLTNSLWNPDYRFTSMATDPAGVKWFATSDGLFRYDDTTWSVFNKTNTPLIENDCRSIAFDQAGILWLGTGGSGLWKYDGSSWTRFYHYNSGLPQNTVCSIAIDENNNKWIGTWEGLAVFNESGVVLSGEDHIPERPEVVVYPNPADQYVTIRSSAIKHENMEQIMIFSITGVPQKVTIIPAGQNAWNVTTGNLSNGIYLAHLRYASGKLASVKFIIRR